jgi:two-component system, chemotaxis family, sensor kinase CheA
MDERLLEVFREESLERLERMSDTLVGAEIDGDAADAIAQLFRDAHSIKGSAGMFGLDRVGALAGAMEDVLARARETGALPARTVAALLSAADAIRAAVADDPRGVEAATLGLRALADDVDEARPPALGAAPDDAAQGGALPAVPAVADPPQPLAPALAPGVGRAMARGGDTHRVVARSLRVRAEKVDRLLAGVSETALHGRRVEHLVAPTRADEALRQEFEHGRTLVAELQDAVLDLRTLPLQTVIGGLARMVRDTAAESGREVRLELTGTDTPLDRAILDGIGDALVHLLRNAVFHGIEPPDERVAAGKPRVGTLRIDARPRGGLVALTCSDDGRGVSAEVLRSVPSGGALVDVLAEAGFSTAPGVTDLAGRGVGLDAVKRHVEDLGGILEVDSAPGSGTTVTLLVPLTLAVISVLLVERAGQLFGVPLPGVQRVLRGVRAQWLHGRRSIILDGATVPVTDLADAVDMDAPVVGEHGAIVAVVSGSRWAAIECDRLLGNREVVVKSLGPLLSELPGYLGAAILDDGGIALLLDPPRLIRATDTARRLPRAAPTEEPPPAAKILVVDDQFTVRELERTILEAAGYRVRTAQDGRAALAVLDQERDVECVISDVEMPGMNGLELLEAIRARPGHSALPVVIVSSRDDDEALSRGADAGADAWVVKSQFEQQALLETVGRLVAPR